MNRRTWIQGLASLSLARLAPGGVLDEEDKAIAAVKETGKKAGLGDFRTQSTRHYVAIGDALGPFQKDAIQYCEDLAADYIGHFQKKQFDVSLPSTRMVLVILKGPAEFAAFLGVDVGAAVGGIYDIETNRLVVFDNRGRPGAGQLERANSISLFHEATHQLCYNTGLLDRQGDVPTCINEGLGVYGEVRKPRGQSKVGDLNKERLSVLRPRNLAWISVSDLLKTDDLFEGKNEDQAYAQAWLLVYHLLKTPARLPQFRDYLKAIKPRRDGGKRLEDATAAFGDLAALDKELKKALARLI